MSESTIEVKSLSRWYGQVIAVNDVDLSIRPGVTGLLGPNGAGKSTLMKVMTGQLRPSKGAVRIHGQPVWNNPAVLSRVGLCPEQDAFYEDMSALAFVSFMLRLHGYSTADADKIARSTLELVDLRERMGDPIRSYSKGMRQRTKLAQAIAHDPDVLFLDEPLTGTDPIGRRRIIDLIQELGDRGKTVVVSSHVLHEVEVMTRNILLINKGRVIADGDIYEIREMIDDHPHQIFVDVSEPRRLAALMSAYEDVTSIRFEEGGVNITTRVPAECYARIPKLALEHGFKIHRLTSPDNNMESVFKYLTGLGYKQTAG